MTSVSHSFLSKETSKKIKYMLGCNIHKKENSHFYCFTCKISFCSLCIQSHESHKTIDKYDYSMPTDGLVNRIVMEIYDELNKIEESHPEFFNINEVSRTDLNRLENQEKSEKIYKNLVNDYKSSDVNQKFLILKDLFLLTQSKTESEEAKSQIKNSQIKIKLINFKSNLNKFKAKCIEALQSQIPVQNESSISGISMGISNEEDLILIEEEIFLEIHNTIQSLELGKESLLKYLRSLYNDIILEKEKDNSIINDGKVQINKEVSERLDQIFDFLIEKSEKDNLDDKDNTQKRVCPQKSRTNHNFSFNYNIDNKQGAISNQDNTSNFESKMTIQSKIFNSSSSILNINNNNNKLYNNPNNGRGNLNKKQTILLKRRLDKQPSILCYEHISETFEIVNLDLNINDKSRMRKFYEFSIFLNVDNKIFISGGKKKNKQNSKLFLVYNYNTNEYFKLSDMIIGRCSHSMIYHKLHNEIYAIGGYGNKTCEKYNINEGNWKQISSLNHERQVSTLFFINSTFLIASFGFTYDISYDEVEVFEKYETSSNSEWEILRVETIGIKSLLRIFNCGVIVNESNSVIICGGETFQGQEIDDVFYISFINNKPLLRYYMNTKVINSNKRVLLPNKSSFIDKAFLQIDENRFFQFEMKRSNVIVFDKEKQEFSVRMLNCPSSSSNRNETNENEKNSN